MPMAHKVHHLQTKHILPLDISIRFSMFVNNDNNKFGFWNPYSYIIRCVSLICSSVSVFTWNINGMEEIIYMWELKNDKWHHVLTHPSMDETRSTFNVGHTKC